MKNYFIDFFFLNCAILLLLLCLNYEDYLNVISILSFIIVAIIHIFIDFFIVIFRYYFIL